MGNLAIRGWALSEERQEEFPANALIPLPPAAEQVEIQQTVNWVFDERITRYTLGLPRQFDQPTTVSWRGLTDLSRVQHAAGESERYQVTSRLAVASAAQLRQTGIGDAFNNAIPPIILARYTGLPASLPARVHDLATEVAGDLPTAYDQARALERFLRQYPYSLDVALPPKEVDPVDFFLFDLQSGYCDYYSSAMAVMARSLGLPARIAVGFLPQTPNGNGIQTIVQINGHSWTEIYFPEYGWIEFEPTAVFPSSHETNPESQSSLDEHLSLETPPEIPPSAPQESVWRRLWNGWNKILLVAGLAVGYWLWQRWQKQVAARDSVVWAYGRLQHQAAKLGQPTQPSQTPDEFTAVLLTWLNDYANNPRLKSLIHRIQPHIERIHRLFVRRRYGGVNIAGKTGAGMTTAQESWQQIRWPLWLLRLVQRVKRKENR